MRRTSTLAGAGNVDRVRVNGADWFVDVRDNGKSARPDVAGRLARATAGTAVFSFVYWGAPPSGRGVQFVAVDGVAAPCTLFSGNTSVTDFISVNVRLNGSTPGRFTIAHEPSLESTVQQGYVEIVTVSEGDASETMRAIGGEIDYLGPANELEFRSGVTASLAGSASFEVDPVTSSECDGGEDARTGAVHTSCQCNRASGATFSCDIDGPGECCQSEIGETVHVQFELSNVAQCPAACAASLPELLVHCRSLASG